MKLDIQTMPLPQLAAVFSTLLDQMLDDDDSETLELCWLVAREIRRRGDLNRMN
jgi:hypothetical protein